MVFFKNVLLKMYFFLFERQIHKGKMERDRSFLYWFIVQIAITTKMGLVESQRPVISWVSHMGAKSEDLCMLRLLAGSWTRSKTTENQIGTDIGCQCHRQRVNLLCQSANSNHMALFFILLI